MQRKILTTFLILFVTVIIFNINSVFGVGIVSQCWVNDIDGDGKNDLIFRTFTGPHENTVKEYHNTQSNEIVENGQWTYMYNKTSYPAKWIYNTTKGIDAPSPYTHRTIGLAFHTQQIGNYSSGTSIGYAYTDKKLGYEMVSIQTSVDRATAQYATPSINIAYPDTVFYEVMRTLGTYSNINWGTGLKITGLYPVGQTEYRYAIVDVGDENNVYKGKGNNVYVTDNVIYNETLMQLVSEAKEVGSIASCYVSNIVISQTLHSSGGYEVARTAKDFFKQYQKSGYSGYFWGNGTRGKDDNKALSAVVNLYDNELIFPQLSKRTVLVRHINVGNNTTISKEIVNSGTRIESNKITIQASNSEGTVTVEGNNYSLNYFGYEEYYEGLLDVEQSIIKAPLEKDNEDKELKVLGYNVGVSSTENGALTNVQSRINNGVFDKFTADIPSVYVDGKQSSSDGDFVVIDIYYTEYDKDVTVNHLYVDGNGKVLEADKQVIKPNDTALINSEAVNRINQDIYTREVYRKQTGYGVEVRISDAMQTLIENDSDYKYLGYEMFDEITDVNRMGSDKVVSSSNTKTKVSIDEEIQVNFYYRYANTTEELEPQKDISGQLNIVSTKTSEDVKCDDSKDNNYSVVTVPSGYEVDVGITGIPRYMVGAITTKTVETNETIDITLKLTMGTQTKTIRYEDIGYNAVYNIVTDMALYKLTNTEIYDTDSGKDGTSGDNLFNWKEKTIKPKGEDLSIKLSGVKNNTINAKDPEDINNINNYVAINVQDKNGNTSNLSASATTLKIPYISETEFNRFDVNQDKIIDEQDIQKSQEILAAYANTLVEKQSEQTAAQTNYNNAAAEESRLKGIFDEVLIELDKRYLVYKNTIIERNNRYNAYSKANSELTDLNNDLKMLQQELIDLEQQAQDELEDKQQADNELTSATTKKDNLYTQYQESVVIRDELKEQANCTDTVEDDVYIYLEQDEKEALEMCRQYKEQYANAEQEVARLYDEYMDSVTEFNDAQNKATQADADYNTAVENITAKENEISILKSKILTQEISVAAAYREYIRYSDNEYKDAKGAYDSYNNNEYKIAKDNYDNYVKQDYVGKAKQALEDAETATQKAQEEYNSYSVENEYLNNNFDNIKKIYNEFVNIDTKTQTEIAETLGLKLNIYVQNMSVKIGDDELYKNNVAKPSVYNLADYINMNDTPKTDVSTEVDIKTNVYENVGGKLSINDYIDNTAEIDEDVLNGVRLLSGKAEYEAQVVIGNKSVNAIEDTVYYTKLNSDGKTHIFRLQNENISKIYKVNNAAGNNTALKYKEVQPVNVYTPITVQATLDVNSSQIIDQTPDDSVLTGSVIQINTPFTVNISSNIKDDVYNNKWQEEDFIGTTKQFNGGYYIKFDFDVHKVSINGKTYKNGNRISAGTWIGIIPKNKDGEAKVVAQAYGNVDDDTLDIISESNGKYTVRAVAYNATSTMLDRSTKYSTIMQITNTTNDLKDMLENICNNSSYFAEQEYGVAIINRVYDFKVTDVKDISWKSVFRKSTSNSTNAHTGNLYYAGTTKWNSSTEKANNIISRPASEIGRNPLRILPIGPYKSTDRTYIKAPKLGYRFSFDMKVTGSYYNSSGEARTDKYVSIKTRFYYISKDGKTYRPESDGTTEGIYLFYKTSAGKYVKIGNDGGEYDLRFTPNDGYRYIVDTATSTLATKSISLGNLRNLTLTKDMATVSNNGSYITYYGEYKLPNSTIAVEVDKDGNYNINSPLKDGYIGVVFDIVAHAGTVNDMPVKLSYSQDTNNEDKPNTSQWDYEGFLGFTKTGTEVVDGMLSIRLEKGTWNISGDEEKGYTANQLYNAIKGTVMLYDLDARAATDYE